MTTDNVACLRTVNQLLASVQMESEPARGAVAPPVGSANARARVGGKPRGRPRKNPAFVAPPPLL